MRVALVALAGVVIVAGLLVFGYFYRAPAPPGYAFPRHNWWGGGPGGLFKGTLVEADGCIRIRGAAASEYTVVWPARYQLRLVDDVPQVVGDNRTARTGDLVELGGGEGGTADTLKSITGETTRCPAPYWITTGWVQVSPGDYHRIGIEVVGPADPWPEQRLVLEIGDEAWAVEAHAGGGVAWPYVDGAQSVRIVRPADCAVLLS